MKKMVIIAVLTFAIITCTGCQQQQKDQTKDQKSQNNLDDNEFPEYLVGTWIPVDNNEVRWIFTFEEDGTISKFRHFMGMDFIVEQGGFEEPWKNNGRAIYDLGPCEAQYDYKTRQLEVVIVVERFQIIFPGDSMEGSFNDYITGDISEDGLTWNAQWAYRTEVLGADIDEPEEPISVTFVKVAADAD